MRIPTVTLRHKKTKETIVINESDYANGTLPGLNFSTTDYERIGERHGDSATENDAVENAKEGAEVAHALAEREAAGKAPKAK